MHLETKHPSELQQLFILNAMREHVGRVLFLLAKRNHLSFTLIFTKPLMYKSEARNWNRSYYWPHFPFKLFMHVFHSRLNIVDDFRTLAAFSFRSSRSFKGFFFPSLFWRSLNLITYWNILHYKINWRFFFSSGLYSL